VEKLRVRDYSNINWENLIAEIEDMGRSERRSGESNLVVILLGLLKWQIQPPQRSGSISLISNLKSIDGLKPLWKSCGVATIQTSTLENLIAEIEDMGRSECRS